MKLLERLLPEFYSTRSNFYFQSDAVCFLMFFNHRRTEIENKAQSVFKHNPLAPAGSSISIVPHVSVEKMKTVFHHIINFKLKKVFKPKTLF